MSQLQSVSLEFKQQELSNPSPMAFWKSRAKAPCPLLLMVGRLGLGRRSGARLTNACVAAEPRGLKKRGQARQSTKATDNKGHGWERSGRGRQGRAG